MEVLNDMFSPYYLQFLVIIWVAIFIYQVIAKHSWVNILIVSLVISLAISAIGIIQFDIIGIITEAVSDFFAGLFEKLTEAVVAPIGSFFDGATSFLEDLFSFDWWPF